MLIVPLQEIGDERIRLQGRFPASFLDLPRQGLAHSDGEVTYDLEIEKDGEVVLAMGSWEAPVRLTCARCGEEYRDLVKSDDWQGDFPLEKDQTSVDIGLLLREDILLSLPEYPRCDESLVAPRNCPADSYVTDHSPDKDPGETDPTGEDDESGPWEKLDNLDFPEN